MQSRYLVTGGAGYVGSHVVAALRRRGAQVVVLDNFCQGHRAAVPEGVRLVVADLADAAAVDRVLAQGPWSAVLHFASLSLVGESMRQPYRYITENVGTAVSLIDACVRHGVRRFVLSSSASVYGNPVIVPIHETAAINPHSPYGETKYMIERALHWADRIHGLRSASLRYFNAAGAAPDGSLGEHHDPETHLIPLVIDTALGRRPELTIFGTDYPTPDGTCVRDYLHVDDLAAAHLLALEQLDKRSVTYNVGIGVGYSVLEVIAAVEAVSGRKVSARIGPSRAGDPSALVAGAELIRRETGWAPEYTSLRDIVHTAYLWRAQNPYGFKVRNDAPPLKVVIAG